MRTKRDIVLEARRTASAALVEELEARVDAMAVTGDVPEPERRLQAVDDILDLSAEDHGAYTDDEIDAWYRIQEAARAERRRILRKKLTSNDK